MPAQSLLSLRRSSLLVTALFSTLLLSGCSVGGDDDEDSEDDITQQEDAFSIEGTTNERGIATVSFQLPEGANKFGITASVRDDELAVRFTDIVSGSGQDYLSAGRGVSLSLADFFARFINAANVPSRDVDPVFANGERFTVSAEVADGSLSESVTGETVRFQIQAKADPGLSAGRLRVNLFFVGDAGQEQQTKDITRSALDQFRSIYSSEAAINLDIQEIDIDGPVVIPSPLDGDVFYARASGGAVNPAINVFVGGDIAGVGGSTLGISASIPGPFHPSERSAVAVSFFTGAGPDGQYSNEEVRALGETIAHEVGHFMGLFHPVDFSGSTVNATDPLDDTDSCSFITECLSNSDLTTNLMFASQVTDGEGGFVQQNQLTNQQRGVMNRYIVTD